jgi:hypothetical protein
MQIKYLAKKERIMITKRFVSIITVIMLAVSLLSCSKNNGTRYIRDDRTISDARFEKIVECLENNDRETLKNMFSVNAVKEAKDLDGSIEYVMDFYKGKLISKDYALQSSDSKEDGVKTSELKGYYEVKADKDEYLIFFVDKVVDNKNPDNMGLYMLQIIKLKDIGKYCDWGTYKRWAGVFRPEFIK